MATPCPSSKPSSVPCLMLLAIDGELVEVRSADAAHQHAAGVERRGRQRLALDDRRGQRDAGHLGDAVGDRVPVGQRLFERLDQQMAVEAEDLVEQFLAEAVHHRHDDDQRRDAEHDAEEGKAGDDRDESFLAPRAQIAQRQHPFERRRRAASPVGSLIDVPASPDFTRFWRIQATEASLAARGHANSVIAPSCASASAGLSISSGCRRRGVLTSTLPSARPLRADHDLPRDADQVGGGELGARPLVAVVVEHVDALGGERAIELLAGRVGRRASPCLRLRIATLNGATASGQMMPASSWEASMIAATSRLGPMP